VVRSGRLGAQSPGAYLGAVLEPQLSWRCYHLKGHGGAKAAVREVTAQLPSHQFVFRTDVESYYASIDHELLYQLLERNIHEKPVLRLLWGYLRRTVYDGGIYRDITRSISLGCSLSPLMGALYLQPLDERMERLGVFYARFMDDWVVLALTTVEAARCYSGGQRGHGGVQGQTTPSKDLDRQGYAFFPGHKGQRHHC